MARFCRGGQVAEETLEKLQHEFSSLDVALNVLAQDYHNGGLSKHAVCEKLAQLVYLADAHGDTISRVSEKLSKISHTGDSSQKRGKKGNAGQRQKKPRKHDYLKDFDIKMEKQMARDRPFHPFARRIKRSTGPPALDSANDIHSGFRPTLAEIKGSPGVLIPRSRYNELKSNTMTSRWARMFFRLVGGKIPQGELTLEDDAPNLDDLRAPEPRHYFEPNHDKAPKEDAFISEQKEPEEVSAILSRRAQEEAELCIGPDRNLDYVRLRAALVGGSDRLNKLLLGRLPYQVLLELKANGPSKILGLPSSFQVPLLGDVVNSALLGEAQRCRKAWLRRPLPLSDDALHATSLGGELLDGVSPVFSKHSGDLIPVTYRGLDAEEEQHPRIDAQLNLDDAPHWNAWLRMVPNIEVFRQLLSMFSSGLLDGFPWGCHNVVLGGSAVTACLALPSKMLYTYGNVLREASIWERSQGIVHKTMVQAFGAGPGSFRAATLILGFVAPNGKDEQMLAELKTKLYHKTSDAAPFNLGDIDVFFSGPTKEAAAEEMARVYEALQTAICRQTANHSSDDVLHVGVRTPNSVTLCPMFPYRHVQLVLRVAEHFSEHLAFADLDCTAVCYDGHNVWAAPRAKRAFETGYNLVSNHTINTKKDCAARIAKYCQRGWGSVIYELCRHEPRCDVCIDSKTRRKLDEARKLVMKPPRFSTGRRYEGLQEDIDTDIAVDLSGVGYDHLHLPRGPQVTPAAISRLLGFQNQEERVIQRMSASDLWKDLVEWRRERKPQIAGEDHDHAGGSKHAGPCYCCGAHCAQDIGGTSASEGRTQVVHICGDCEKRDGDRRAQKTNLSGYTAVVTGGRCKIGYEVCLKLLRCGAFVVVTTRFPRCAAQKFLNEQDALDWIGRLHVYGLDFTHFGMLSGFLTQINGHYKPDILVNNAAQTIRRPPEYYVGLIEEEARLLEPNEESVREIQVSDVVRELGSDPWQGKKETKGSKNRKELKRKPDAEASDETPGGPLALADSIGSNHVVALADSIGSNHVVEVMSDKAALAVNSSKTSSAESSLWFGHELADKDVEKFFPHGQQDLHGEQLDLRPSTSWTSTVSKGDITGRELLEVLAVNAAAPFMLFQGLIPLLRQGHAAGCHGRFIVNVTSAEGVFSVDGSSSKTSEHPHTNMAKAALNMLTKTSAPELATFGVYCTAVDPGWVSMMRPGDPNVASRPLPPLSEKDGAARVVAPILDGVNALSEGRSPVYGVLLRNFNIVPW
jgi:NAD(P)-dependent dehydrogenase (short-subunit alcohol dehydrogenase family)